MSLESSRNVATEHSAKFNNRKLVVQIPFCQVPRGANHDAVIDAVIQKLEQCNAIFGFNFRVLIGGYVPTVTSSDTGLGTFDVIAAAAGCASDVLNSIANQGVPRA